MTQQEKANRQQAIARALDDLDAASHGLEDAETKLKDYKSAVTLAAKEADYWKLEDGRWTGHVFRHGSGSDNWPTAADIVSVLGEIQQCKARIAEATDDLKRHGLNPDKWQPAHR